MDMIYYTNSRIHICIWYRIEKIVDILMEWSRAFDTLRLIKIIVLPFNLFHLTIEASIPNRFCRVCRSIFFLLPLPLFLQYLFSIFVSFLAQRFRLNLFMLNRNNTNIYRPDTT